MIYYGLDELLSLEDKDAYWIMNLTDEQNWNKNSPFPSLLSDTTNLVVQQEQQLLLLNKKHTVLFQHQPSAQFLTYLKKKGIQIPKIKLVSDFRTYKENSVIVPFINTESIEKWSEIKGVKVFGSDSSLVKLINNKYWVRELMLKYGFLTTKGYFCKGEEETRKAYTRLSNDSFKKYVLKLPYGSSGKGLFIFKELQEVNSILKRNGDNRLLIEGWHESDRQLNTQILIDENINILSITEQIINHNAKYLGTNFTPTYKKEILDNYKSKIWDIAEIIKNLGYKGVLGIDSILDREGNLYPAIEINARFTQVSYLTSLIKNIDKKYIESRTVDLFSKTKRSFNELNIQLDKLLSRHGFNYTIYTFAESFTGSKYLYRIYVLFYTDYQVLLNSQIELFYNYIRGGLLWTI
ncbi:ATP-grasp domain-containing protein [Oceanobacillus sp. 1P07AA]|uniref:ATP-grasp domain-containing protein n=1 Tax=Oceanobacillus sp. 1P07AA TaxID=3132293 RepID=UPI0039A47515